VWCGSVVYGMKTSSRQNSASNLVSVFIVRVGGDPVERENGNCSWLCYSMIDDPTIQRMIQWQ